MVCESCGREMRSAYRTHEVVVCGEVDDVFNYCFLCVKEDERREAKALRAEAEALRAELEREAEAHKHR